MKYRFEEYGVDDERLGKQLKILDWCAIM